MYKPATTQLLHIRSQHAAQASLLLAALAEKIAVWWSTLLLCAAVWCRAKLVDLDLGCAAPIITGLEAASCPGTGGLAAPQLQMKVMYQVRLPPSELRLLLCAVL